MLKRTATYHEFLDDCGRRFVVRLAHGMAVAVIETALGRARIEWQARWGTYRPLSEATAQRVVEEFLAHQSARQAAGGPTVERINAELLEASQATYQRPAARAPVHDRAVHDTHERQLPAGDRT